MTNPTRAGNAAQVFIRRLPSAIWRRLINGAHALFRVGYRDT